MTIFFIILGVLFLCSLGGSGGGGYRRYYYANNYRRDRQPDPDYDYDYDAQREDCCDRQEDCRDE